MSFEGQFYPDDANQNSSGSDLRIAIGDPPNGSHLGSDKIKLSYLLQLFFKSLHFFFTSYKLDFVISKQNLTRDF